MESRGIRFGTLSLVTLSNNVFAFRGILVLLNLIFSIRDTIFAFNNAGGFVRKQQDMYFRFGVFVSYEHAYLCP